ncbi:MAG: DUF3303 family protein [Chloroflexi bacterium]|nr:DUF3303 family protein [Chloroflexota bacterium]
MLFISVLSQKQSLSRQQLDESAQRRARWKYPPGMKVLAEYWLQGSPQVITIIEAEHIGPVLQSTYAWADVFDIRVHPAVTAEDGLRTLQAVGIIKRRGRRPKSLRTMPPPPPSSAAS